MSGSQPRDALRQELSNYVRRTLVRRPHEPILIAARALRARQARRGAPAGLVLDDERADVPQRRAALPFTSGEAPAPAHVRLATREWPLSAGDPWTQTFDDPEDAFASHRFSWVIPALASSARAATLAQAMLERWLAHAGEAHGGPGWDSYSVAERLTAAIYLQSAGAAASARLDSAIRAHARHLLSHLEMRGASTNNHLLNDARALYLAGAWLGDTALVAPARAIFDFAVPAMYDDGFLREGSTHYHQLLHRTLIEIACLAPLAGDAAFAERASAWARASASAARFVNAGEPGMPRIGDLSPDFTPETLAAWAGWLGADAAAGGSPDVPPPDAGARGGYLRARASEFLLHAWVTPAGHVPAWSHAHADLGSFTLSCDGRPLLIDGGRATYAPSPMSAFGRSVRSHNAISIDGFEPCVAHGVNGYPELFGAAYIDARPAARVSGDGTTARVEIAHDGFARLGSSLRHSRSVTLGPGNVSIEDRITGSGRHRVETFFHFAPECVVEPAGPGVWRVALPDRPAFLFESGAGASLQRGVREPRFMGWSAREYGAAVPSPSIVCDRTLALPSVQTYTLRHA